MRHASSRSARGSLLRIAAMVATADGARVRLAPRGMFMRHVGGGTQNRAGLGLVDGQADAKAFRIVFLYGFSSLARPKSSTSMVPSPMKGTRSDSAMS